MNDWDCTRLGAVPPRQAFPHREVHQVRRRHARPRPNRNSQPSPAATQQGKGKAKATLKAAPQQQSKLVSLPGNRSCTGETNVCDFNQHPSIKDPPQTAAILMAPEALPPPTTEAFHLRCPADQQFRDSH
ncbi:hypothetical protein TYRP_023301 [Tyrophagus putrescentiae]|nr:hypothetical protein TYRP_023301 [Tyrophagus putrescentiae]